MMGVFRKITSFVTVCGIGWAALAGGCAATVDLAPKPDLVPKELPTKFDDRDWTFALRQNVRDKLVDYDHLARQRAPLDRFLGLISVVGPESTPGLFPNKQARLAYWINVYNAQVWNIVLSQYPTKSVHELSRPDLEMGYIFVADGKRRTLAEIRQSLLTESGGDVRIHFALCGAAMGEPALRDRPYRGESLDRDLATTAAEAMNNPQIVNILHDVKELRVWMRIRSERAAFVKYHQIRLRTRGVSLLSVLLELAADERRAILNTAVGYQERTVPFDRRLNQWQPAKSP